MNRERGKKGYRQRISPTARNSSQSPFLQAEREQTSLLAPVEKRLLRWFAARVPARVNSDHLTLLGFIAMLAAGGFYAAARWNRYSLVAVIGCLALNWYGDSLDGTLARMRNRQRPRYGFYVDHMTDAFGTAFLLAGMAFSGYMNPFIGLGLLIVYLILSIQSYLATYTLGTFHLSFWKFSPTELRVVLAIGNVALLFRPWVKLGPYGPYRLFDVGGIVGFAGMLLMVTAATIRNTAALYRQERLP
jgi:phosphatidylglycerophosphate synthase